MIPLLRLRRDWFILVSGFLRMSEKIAEKVRVSCDCQSMAGKLVPTVIFWRGREYRIEKIGLHFPLRQGRVLHHIFSVLAGGNFFRLNLDTESLVWVLEEVEAS